MGIFDFLKPKSNSAAEAKKRLMQVLIATRPGEKGAPDFLPMLRQDILAVLQKHVPGFDPEGVSVELHKDGEQDVLDITVSLADGTAKATAS
ncbi:MAG: cell division topological specificity factor MinE [Lysobacteraceae bacterium]